MRNPPWLRLLFALVAAAVLSVSVAACGDDEDDGNGGSTASAASDGSPFKVLAILPASGPVAAVGQLEIEGMNAAKNVVNADGGILGHPVEIEVADSAGDGDKAVSIVQEKATSGEYDLIVAGALGLDAVPLAPALAGVQSLQITNAGEDVLNDPEKYPNLFISASGFGPNAEGTVAQLQEDGIGSVSLVAGDSTTGRNATETMKSQAEAAGIEVNDVVLVPETATDATPQMQKVADSNPEAIVMSGFTPATGPVIAARTKLGLTDVPTYCDSFCAAAPFQDFTKKADRENLFLQSHPWLVEGNAAQDAPEFQDFLTEVRKLNAKPPLPYNVQAVGYNDIILARAAAEAADSIEGPAMVEALAKLTDKSQAPGWFQSAKIYTPDSRLIAATGDDFVYSPAGIWEKGLLQPGA
jgi:branched-chain amino acid transport system substrate-binding protein